MCVRMKIKEGQADRLTGGLMLGGVVGRLRFGGGRRDKKDKTINNDIKFNRISDSGQQSNA